MSARRGGLLLGLALLASFTVRPGSVQAEPVPDEPVVAPPRVMVVGDSISNIGWRYGATPSATRPTVWWSGLMSWVGIDPTSVVVDAVNGSGYGRVSCDPAVTPFIDRLEAVRAARPDVLIVSGGRNDVTECRDGAKVRISAAASARHARDYFASLARVADEIGLAREDVFVATPWGTSWPLGRAWVVPAVEQAAEAQGFTWIMTPAMTVERAPDGTHPSSGGAAWLAQQVARSGSLMERLRGGPRKDLAGSTEIATASDRGFLGRTDERFWGRLVADPQNFVAYALTHGDSVAFPPGLGLTAADWPVAFVTDGAALSTVPRVGDVAWWSNGRVGLVEAAGESVVDVTVWSEGALRTVRYRLDELPDVYVRPRRTGGEPAGVLRHAEAPTRSTVRVVGFASDTDAYDTGTTLRVTVTQGGDKHYSTVQWPSRFAFDRTIEMAGLKPGTARVSVTAYNAPGTRGAAQVHLGTLTVTVP